MAAIFATARALSGTILFGPQRLPRNEALAILREELLRARTGGRPEQVQLLRGTDELRDDANLDGDQPGMHGHIRGAGDITRRAGELLAAVAIVEMGSVPPGATIDEVQVLLRGRASGQRISADSSPV